MVPGRGDSDRLVEDSSDVFGIPNDCSEGRPSGSLATMWSKYKFGTLANKLEDAIEALMANDQPIGVIDYGDAGG